LKIAVYSNVSSSRQGGGVLYIASLAAALGQKHHVELFFRGNVEAAELEQTLPRALSGIKIGRLQTPARVPLLREIKEVLTNNKYDMVISQSTHIPRLHHRGNSVLLCEFPVQKDLRMSERARLGRIGSLVANSSFTAGWIERRWGRKAEVLHPAVFPIGRLSKQPWILAVGRLLSGKRSKCQLEMIQMFREMVAGGLQGWQLHIAGMVQDEDYGRRVREAAAGLPVVLHLDISRAALEELYGKASIFWHATGIQCDPESEPECMEHFGIATAEAMSAGAIPLVINRGGQPEIIGAPENGILWNTFEECKDETWKLTHDQARLDSMSGHAARRAEDFFFPSFTNRVTEIFERN
jgi:glycosyltransferase involved in cell wall biosynthesis